VEDRPDCQVSIQGLSKLCTHVGLREHGAFKSKFIAHSMTDWYSIWYCI